MSNSAPDGYLICDGTEYNIDDYKTLSNHFKEQFGATNYFGGDGVDTFCVPDLQGEFLRGSGTNSHTNQGSGSDVGEHQDGTTLLEAIDQQALIKFSNTDAEETVTGSWRGEANAATSSTIKFTSRPTNTSVLFCICAYELSKESDSTELPIGFDETETETQVSWYKRADGKVKPIWRKDYVSTYSGQIEVGQVLQTYTNEKSLLNIEYVINGTASCTTNNGANYDCQAYNSIVIRTKENDIVIECKQYLNGVSNIKCSIYFTKTSDEWQ